MFQVGRFARVPMSLTQFTCGCVEVEGVREYTGCTEGHTADRVEVVETAPVIEESADAKARRLEAEAALAAGKEPKDTRTAAEKRADKQAAKDA